MDSNSPSPAPSVPDVATLPPPSAPRPLNVDTQRPLWSEPRVRRWWLLMILLMLTFCGYVADRLYARHVEGQLINTGVLMPATVLSTPVHGPNQPYGTNDEVTILVNWPDHSEELTGFLSKEGLVRGTVQLHIDPADHTRWTDRTEPTPLLDSLFVGLLLLPLIPVLAFVAFVQQRRLQKIWQSGTAAIATVFDRRQSAIAPLSYAVRCSLRDSRNKDLFTVFVPRIGHGLAKGDAVWVLVPKKGKPLAALWMGAAGRQGQAS